MYGIWLIFFFLSFLPLFNLHLVKLLYFFTYLVLVFKPVFCICVVWPFYFCLTQLALTAPCMPRTIGLIEMQRAFKNCIDEGVVLQQDRRFRYNLYRTYLHRPEFRRALSSCLNMNPWMGLFRFSSASMDCGYMLLCFEIKKAIKNKGFFFKLTYQPKCCKESIVSSSAEYFCSVFNLLPSVTFFLQIEMCLYPFFSNVCKSNNIQM